MVITYLCKSNGSWLFHKQLERKHWRTQFKPTMKDLSQERMDTVHIYMHMYICFTIYPIRFTVYVLLFIQCDLLYIQQNYTSQNTVFHDEFQTSKSGRNSVIVRTHPLRNLGCSVSRRRRMTAHQNWRQVLTPQWVQTSLHTPQKDSGTLYPQLMKIKCYVGGKESEWLQEQGGKAGLTSLIRSPAPTAQQAHGAAGLTAGVAGSHTADAGKGCTLQTPPSEQRRGPQHPENVQGSGAVAWQWLLPPSSVPQPLRRQRREVQGQRKKVTTGCGIVWALRARNRSS